MSARDHRAAACRLAGAAVAALLMGNAGPVEAAELPRGTLPRLAWEPPAGGADSYVVEGLCNGGERIVRAYVFEPRATLRAGFCDTLTVRVAATRGGEVGPFSPESDPIFFVDPLAGSSGGGVGPPPDGTGNRSSTAPKESGPADPAATQAAAGADTLDFDGDGRGDVLLRDEARSLEVWSLEGRRAVVLGALPGLGASVRVVGNGDSDGDGRADLLYLDDETGELGLWLLAGGALIGGGSIGTVPEGWDVVSHADHDGDGRADALLHHGESGALELWTLVGPELVATTPVSRPAPRGAVPVASGDYDGDGHADLAWHHPDAELISVWILSGPQVVATSSIGTGLGSGWEVAAGGDFDGDGFDDLAWQQPASGRIGLWFFRNGAFAAQSRVDVDTKARLRVICAADHDGDGLDDLLLLVRAKNRLKVWFMNGSVRRAQARIGDLSGAWSSVGVGQVR